MNRGQVAAKVREQKEKHPEMFCTAKNCLWRTGGQFGTPCRKHPHASISMGRVVVDDLNEFALPEVENA